MARFTTAGMLETISDGGRWLIYRLLALFVFGFIVAFAFYYGISLYQYKHFYDWTMLFAGSGLGALLFLSVDFRRSLERIDARLALGGIVLVAVALRLWSMDFLDTRPIFDYLSYHKAAVAVTQANWQGLNILEGKPWGYPLLLGLAYQLFGASVQTAQGLNIVLSIWVILALYLLTRRLISPVYGLLASFLFAVFPSMVFMTNVINSEILFMGLCVTALYFAVGFMQDYRVSSLAAAGLLLGLAHQARPVGMIYLLLFAGFLFLQLFPGHVKPLLRYLLILFFSFYLAMVPFLGLKSYTAGRPILWEKGTYGMVLLMGTNVKYNGYWNQPDYDFVKRQQVRYHNDAQKVNDEAFRFAVWRLRSTRHFERILPTKAYYMWSADTYGFQWANNGPGGKPSLRQAKAVRYYYGLSQMIYTLTLLAIWFGMLLFRLEKDAGFRFFTTIILGFFALHLLLEAQGRYHMHLVPWLLVMLTYVLYNMDNRHAAGGMEGKETIRE